MCKSCNIFCVSGGFSTASFNSVFHHIQHRGREERESNGVIFICRSFLASGVWQIVKQNSSGPSGGISAGSLSPEVFWCGWLFVTHSSVPRYEESQLPSAPRCARLSSLGNIYGTVWKLLECRTIPWQWYSLDLPLKHSLSSRFSR